MSVERPGARVGRRTASRRRRIAPGSFAVLVLAFFLLLGAAASIAWAQIRASHIAPWVSIGFSAAAVVATIAAVTMSRRSID
jgi:hypothetical protein